MMFKNLPLLAQLFLLGLTCSFSVGCTTLFFQPTQVDYKLAEDQKVAYTSIDFKSEDGTNLKARYFEAAVVNAAHPEWGHYHGRTRGLVVQFHGNAQNMTAHFMNEAWLLLEGYDLLVFDYRGYGDSSGSLSTRGVYQDSQAGLKLAASEATKRGLPLIAYAQSLGGSLLLRVLEDSPPPSVLKMVVVESSFHSYQEIAREKLASFWLTWPLQWVAYGLISDEFSPGSEKLALISPTPVYLIYSEQDPVVTINHGEEIFRQLHDPKTLLRHPNPGHINAMFVEDGRYRAILLKQMAKYL